MLLPAAARAQLAPGSTNVRLLPGSRPQLTNAPPVDD